MNIQQNLNNNINVINMTTVENSVAEQIVLMRMKLE
jgi:hypothetical protein